MSKTPAQLLADVRSLIEADPDAVGLIDRCNVINRTYTTNGDGGTTADDTDVVASDVPCLIERRTHRSAQLAGGQVSNVDHDLYLIASTATRGIKPNYVLEVAERDDSPAREFEQPVILEETMGPLVVIGATLKL